MVLVEQRGAGGEYLAQGGLDGLDVGEGQGLPQVAADVVFGGYAVDALQCGIDQEIAQVGVHEGEADRGLVDQPLGEGQVGLDALEQVVVGRDAEGVDIPEIVQQPHVAELHQAGAAVLVPDGEGAGPAPAGRHHLREQTLDGLQVLRVYEQSRCVLTQGLFRGVAEEILGLRSPEHDAPAGVQDHRGNAQHIQQTDPPGRLGARLVSAGREGFGCHPRSSSTSRQDLPASAGKAARSGSEYPCFHAAPCLA